MAASLRRDDEEDDAPMSDINVTPLVDVMLVLLIVFMIAAPLMTSGIPVDLPKAQAKPLADQKPPLAVSVNAAGHTFIGSDEVPSEGLLTSLKNQAENELDRRIHVRADKELPYRTVLEVMAQINAAGFTKVALVSEAPKTAAALPPQGEGSSPQATSAAIIAPGPAPTSTPGAGGGAPSEGPSPLARPAP